MGLYVRRDAKTTPSPVSTRNERSALVRKKNWKAAHTSERNIEHVKRLENDTAFQSWRSHSFVASSQHESRVQWSFESIGLEVMGTVGDGVATHYVSLQRVTHGCTAAADETTPGSTVIKHTFHWPLFLRIYPCPSRLIEPRENCVKFLFSNYLHAYFICEINQMQFWQISIKIGFICGKTLLNFRNTKTILEK